PRPHRLRGRCSVAERPARRPTQHAYRHDEARRTTRFATSPRTPTEAPPPRPSRQVPSVIDRSTHPEHRSNEQQTNTSSADRPRTATAVKHEHERSSAHRQRPHERGHHEPARHTKTSDSTGHDRVAL